MRLVRLKPQGPGPDGGQGPSSDCSIPIYSIFSGFSKINRGRTGLLLYYVDST